MNDLLRAATGSVEALSCASLAVNFVVMFSENRRLGFMVIVYEIAKESKENCS